MSTAKNELFCGRMMTPLNGAKTHPLSAHALTKLRDMASKPYPRQAVNPGVANRLLREELVESVMLPSPFRTHAGKALEHLRITDAGREAAGLTPTPIQATDFNVMRAIDRKRQQANALHGYALQLGATPGRERDANNVSKEAAIADAEIEKMVADAECDQFQ